MFIVHVQVQVKPEHIEAFKEVTLANAKASIQEPGVVRFDVLQRLDDPARFTLMEAYRTPEDPAKHKQTAHYTKWAEAVTPMMAVPRERAQYSNVFPAETDW
jgi:autoinducer 2-degrading protein